MPVKRKLTPQQIVAIRAKKANAAQSVQMAPGIFRGRGAYYQRAQRSNRFYGRGDYFAPGAGRKLGGKLGSLVGQPGAGAAIGDAAQEILKAIGMGDYTVSSNSLLGEQGVPMIVNSKDNRVIIRHKEYLGNVITSSNAGAFKLQSFPLNPGLVQSFPWLAQIATGFEQYKLRGMIVEFKSTCGSAISSTNNALGSVIMATEYDSTRPVFSNQQQMANHEFANSCAQDKNSLHAIECKKSQNVLGELWVRSGAVPAGDDERFYDHGLFQIATVGSQGASINIGELWFSYEIEFLKPQLISGIGLQLLTDKYHSTTASTSTYFGSASAVPLPESNLGTVVSGNTLLFPSTMSEGTFQVTYLVNGSSIGVANVVVSTVNCTLLQVWNNSSATFISNGGTTAAIYWITFLVQLTGQNADFTFSSGTFPTSITNMDMVISQVNGNITV